MNGGSVGRRFGFFFLSLSLLSWVIITENNGKLVLAKSLRWRNSYWAVYSEVVTFFTSAMESISLNLQLYLFEQCKSRLLRM